MFHGPLTPRSQLDTPCHPALMAGIARLFGLSTVPLAQARILLVGVGAGGLPLSLAAAFPKAQILALDVMQGCMGRLRGEATRLGLTNLSLKTKSHWEIENLGPAFDYVICPDAYSAVRQDLQDTLLELIARNLAPEGLACVGFKVLPGWRAGKPLREAFNAMLVPELEPQERRASALDLATLVKSATAGQGAYGAAAAAWADLLAASTAQEVSQDLLPPFCLPSTFAEFAAHAAAARLGYVGELDVPGMSLKRFPPEIVEAVRRRCSNNLVATEQMIDLLTGRPARSSILIHGRRLAGLERRLSPAVLQGLHLAATPGIEITERDGAATLSLPQGGTLALEGDLIQAAVGALYASAPATRAVDDLAPAAEQPALRAALYPLVLAGALIPFAEPMAKAPIPNA